MANLLASRMQGMVTSTCELFEAVNTAAWHIGLMLSASDGGGTQGKRGVPFSVLCAVL